MCGIAGLVSKTGKPPGEAVLRRMVDGVAHRGPDGEGLFADGPDAFAHRRLSIIDLSDEAAQPMTLAGTRLTITYNGEIYNFRELRAELATLGHVFRTQSDTEVILAAYRQWGEACLSPSTGCRLRHPRPRASAVFCARDRFGVKPFYYVDRSDWFAFGSEIRQLLPFLAGIGTDRHRVKAFIVTGAIDLDERTLFNGVLKLPAGHYATYDLQENTFTTMRYAPSRDARSWRRRSERTLARAAFKRHRPSAALRRQGRHLPQRRPRQFERRHARG